MESKNLLTLGLGLIIFSFTVTSILLVPFINLLYKFHLIRRKEAVGGTKTSLFDKLHDYKAGTPIGGGVLIIISVSLIFFFLLPFTSRMGISIRSSFPFKSEVFIIFFTFVGFGILGLLDDLMKIFGKPKPGLLGMWVGLNRRSKFILQCIFALIIAWGLYKYLGISILYIPLIGKTINLGLMYIPFAAFVIVSFANAFNITDGLDGLSCGLLLICLIAFVAISAGTMDTPLSVFNACMIGSLIAFLYFNIYPARIHLGDVGSMSFGATLALIGLLTGSIIALIIIAGIFVVEIVSSAIQILGWKYLKKPILPLAPLHNSFLAIGWEEPKIVMRAWLAGLILAIFGLWLATI